MWYQCWLIEECSLVTCSRLNKENPVPSFPMHVISPHCKKGILIQGALYYLFQRIVSNDLSTAHWWKVSIAKHNDFVCRVIKNSLECRFSIKDLEMKRKREHRSFYSFTIWRHDVLVQLLGRINRKNLGGLQSCPSKPNRVTKWIMCSKTLHPFGDRKRNDNLKGQMSSCNGITRL